jgi:hypothetical protein
MMERIDMSPRLTARIAGVFYLLTILTGAFAQAFDGQIVVRHNFFGTDLEARFYKVLTLNL